MMKGPINVKNALAQLRGLGFKPFYNADVNYITFYFKGNKIILWCKKGWFSGRGVEDGYGLDNLISQLKGEKLHVKICE